MKKAEAQNIKLGRQTRRSRREKKRGLDALEKGSKKYDHCRVVDVYCYVLSPIHVYVISLL
jgi:hypothetical protein